MKILSFIVFAAMLALAGCKGVDSSATSKPASRPSKKNRGHAATAPGSMPAAGATDPAERVNKAREFFAGDLLLLRKHSWSVPANPRVMAAARRVFGSPPAVDSAGTMRNFPPGVDFTGMTDVQVRSLVGNPRDIVPGEGFVEWNYSYGVDGGFTAVLRLARGRVTSLSYQTHEPLEIR